MKFPASYLFFPRAMAMFILLASAAVCSEPWGHKQPDRWTAQDVQQVLTDSPWVRQGSVRFPDQPAVHDESPGSAQADPMAAGASHKPVVIGVISLQSGRKSRLLEAFEQHCKSFVSDAYIPGMTAPLLDRRRSVT